MKQVILIGAKGRTSREIIPRLLQQPELRLTLFLRDAKRLQLPNDSRIAIFEGDATRLDDLRQAVAGQDIVISTLGGADLDSKTANLVQAMTDAGVRRLIALCAGGIYDELPEPFNSWDREQVGHTRPVNLKMAQVIERSALDYTLLRPVWLTDAATEAYQLTAKGETYRGTETSRASLSRFIAEVVVDPALHLGENLGISQPNTDGDRPAAYR